MKYILLILFSIVLISCMNNVDQKKETGDSDLDEVVLPTLSPEQQSAFQALNTLQVSTDRQNHLYSTFANIEHPCFPPDTSFSVNRSELLIVMQAFVTKHCQNLPLDQRNELVETAVKAQESYEVLHCIDISEHVNYDNGIPPTGTWILPNILDRRDLLLVW